MTLKHEQIKNDPQRISKIRPFVDQYNWKKINFRSHKNDWYKFEKNNKKTLSLLFFPCNTEEIRPRYVSKHNLQMAITDGKKQHYLDLKKSICIA